LVHFDEGFHVVSGTPVLLLQWQAGEAVARKSKYISWHNILIRAHVGTAFLAPDLYIAGTRLL